MTGRLLAGARRAAAFIARAAARATTLYLGVCGLAFNFLVFTDMGW